VVDRGVGEQIINSHQVLSVKSSLIPAKFNYPHFEERFSMIQYDEAAGTAVELRERQNVHDNGNVALMEKIQVNCTSTGNFTT